MPLRVFLSHASADKPFVEEVKRFLDDGGDIECWLDSFEIGLGQNIALRIQDGLARSDFVLLFLSPVSVKSRWVEEEWAAAYWTQVNSGETHLIPVLIGNCKPPLLLANKKFCDLRTNQLEGMRRLKAELLRAKPATVTVSGAGASLPFFVGREAELIELKERLSQPGSLVPIVGMPGLGKTYLAREFIRRHEALFEAVYDLDCQQKDLAALTGELSAQVGLKLDGDAQQLAAELRRFLAGKRCLLLLDNVDDDQPGELVPSGRAAVLVTSRIGSIPFIADYPDLNPPLFTEQEALDLFRRVLGAVSEEPAKRLFQKLGYLPIALRVSAGLIRHDVRYTVESMADALPPTVSELLRKAVAALDENERRLLVAMAACAPGGVLAGFAAEVARLSEPDSLDALQGLFARSLVEEVDRARRWYRLHPLVREAAAPGEEVRRVHAERVSERLKDWRRAPLQSAELIEEAEQAWRDFGGGSGPLPAEIALDAGNLAKVLGRLAEAREFYLRVQQSATRTGRKGRLQAGFWGEALVLFDWGRLGESMALYKKQEALCQELGDRHGLQASYGHQALILKAWDRLDEAMELHKKEEAICHELGEGLQASYANQAIILQTWGRLEEAMALHKKGEAICLELDDRAGLAGNYCNQAIILKTWGRLDEAMALHKKEEAMSLELGDRRELAYCYWNMGLVLRAQGKWAEGRKKLRQALRIFMKLQMPREREKVQRLLNDQPPQPPH